MGHAEVHNRSGLAASMLFLLDEEARSVCTVVVKGTFRVLTHGSCVPVDEQPEVLAEPVPYGEPETTSLRLDTEVWHFKPACDVVVLGHARAPVGGAREMLVGLRVGPVQKGIAVLGERTWSRSVSTIKPTRPLPFETMPLVYERAFGGWDKDGEPKSFEARNPVGVGFRTSARGFHEDLRLPNLEDPVQRLTAYGQRVVPTGCGFVAPHWQPRAALAGTYDAVWQANRAPRYPKDFDRRFFNAASPGLIAPGFLRGDEPFIFSGVGPRGELRGNLPGGPPRVVVRKVRDVVETLTMNLDTVIVHADEEQVQILWRGHTLLPRGPHDVRAVAITRSN